MSEGNILDEETLQEITASRAHYQTMDMIDKAHSMKKTDPEASRELFLVAAFRECFYADFVRSDFSRGIMLLNAYNIYKSQGDHDLVSECRKVIMECNIPAWMKFEVSQY